MVPTWSLEAEYMADGLVGLSGPGKRRRIPGEEALGWAYGWAPLAYTAEEALNSQMTQLVVVRQPLSSLTWYLYDGFLNRAAMMAEMMTPQHTHNSQFTSSLQCCQKQRVTLTL